MSRSCKTCQHLKRPEIDRRLAGGEPAAQVARGYELNPSSVHRHRANCLKLAASSEIKKEAARGTAAVALLPSKEVLSSNYLALIPRVDQIAEQAKQQNSLKVALTGLTDIRKTLDSLTRLAGHDRSSSSQVAPASNSHGNINTAAIAERLIQEFDHEPDIKARIAATLLSMDKVQTEPMTGSPGPSSGVSNTALSQSQPTGGPEPPTAASAAEPSRVVNAAEALRADAEPIRPGVLPIIPAASATLVSRLSPATPAQQALRQTPLSRGGAS